MSYSLKDTATKDGARRSAPPPAAAAPVVTSPADPEGQLLAMELEPGSAAWEATVRARTARLEATSGGQGPLAGIVQSVLAKEE